MGHDGLERGAVPGLPAVPGQYARTFFPST